MAKQAIEKDIFRIIDANLNRSREGLRVCEEVVRFIVHSPALTAELKGVRHAISTLVRQLRAKELRMFIASRDAAGDIGRTLEFKKETKKTDTIDLFAANIERVKESLRVLEEFFKLLDKSASARCMRLRFKVYDIENKALKKISAVRHH